MKRLATIGEASLMLGVSRETIRRLIAAGRLAPVRAGRRVLLPLPQVEQLCRTGWRWHPAYETRAVGQPEV